MKAFLTKFFITSLITTICVVGISVIFYDVLPRQYSYFHRDHFQKIYVDYFQEQGHQYNSIIVGLSDAKRNVIPLVLDEQDPTGETKSFTMGMGGLTYSYIIDYLDFLIAHNPNINRVIFGMAHPTTGKLLKNQKNETDHKLLWGSLTPSSLFFYTKYFKYEEKYDPIDLGKIVAQKYLGTNLMNIVKYHSLGENIEYTPHFYGQITQNAGDRGLLPVVIKMGTELLGEEVEKGVCGEKCQSFFKQKRALTLSKVPLEEKEQNSLLAEKEVSELQNFAQRLNTKGIDIIFVYFPSDQEQDFLRKEVVAQLKEKDCFVIDFANPKKYPEFYDHRYSFGRYQNRAGAVFASEAIGKIISQNTHEYQCHQ